MGLLGIYDDKPPWTQNEAARRVSAGQFRKIHMKGWMRNSEGELKDQCFRGIHSFFLEELAPVAGLLLTGETGGPGSQWALRTSGRCANAARRTAPTARKARH